MLSVLRRIALIVLASSCCAQAQHTGTIHNFHTEGWAKAENGLIISWQRKSKDATAAQVHIFDKQGHSIASLAALRLVPDAAEVDIKDVSARPGQIIAISAVYVSKEGSKLVRPASTLLQFDFEGRLLSFFSLAPWRDIARLEVDRKSNVWALNSNAEEGTDPAQSSMITVYTTKGSIDQEMLPRNLFPSHADEIRGDAETGFPVVGYDSRGLWFWLPGSTDLVAIPAGGGNPVRMKTGLPKGDAIEYPVNLVRETSGALVAHFREGLKPAPVYYRWSPSTNSWARFKPGACDGGWLAGADENEQVYLKQNATIPGDTDICVFGVQ